MHYDVAAKLNNPRKMKLVIPNYCASIYVPIIPNKDMPRNGFDKLT